MLLCINVRVSSTKIVVPIIRCRIVKENKEKAVAAKAKREAAAKAEEEKASEVKKALHVWSDGACE